jgi:hypothetical protein
MQPKSAWPWKSVAVACALLTAGLGLLAPANGAAQAQPSASPMSDLLVDLYGNPGQSYISSQNFAAVLDAFDDRAADDFIIDRDGNWRITAGEFGGEYRQVAQDSDRTVEAINVQIYADASGMPGPLMYQATVAPTGGLTTGEFSLALSPGPVLQGHVRYWVSAQAIKQTTGGTWVWRERAGEPFGLESVWRNPGNVGGHGCTTYKYRVTVCERGIDHDLRFRLYGTEVKSIVYLPMISR